MTFELIHPNIDSLKAASAQLQQKLESFDGLFDINDSYERANDEFELDLKTGGGVSGHNGDPACAAGSDCIFWCGSTTNTTRA